MAVNMHPAMMNGMNGMRGPGGMQQMFMMMQMMQMMQMMMSMMGSAGGGFGGGGCGCHGGFGRAMGYGAPMGMPMPNPGYSHPPMSHFGGHHAPAISGQALSGATSTGHALAQSIMRTPVPPRCRPGYCYRGVKHHLRNVGVNIHGGSAYQAADQLAQHRNKFKEVSVSRAQLKKLPPGAVVVWNRSPGKPHGHISIATGDGREASDKIRNQMTNRPASYRVFLPK